MATRTRPDPCCSIASAPVAISPSRRDAWLGWFRALSEPTRLDILLLLAGQEGPLCACDVGDRFDLTQPTISHHMKVLVGAGLVDATKSGVWAYYELTSEGRELFESLLQPAKEAVGVRE